MIGQGRQRNNLRSDRVFRQLLEMPHVRAVVPGIATNVPDLPSTPVIQGIIQLANVTPHLESFVATLGAGVHTQVWTFATPFNNIPCILASGYSGTITMVPTIVPFFTNSVTLTSTVAGDTISAVAIDITSGSV